MLINRTPVKQTVTIPSQLFNEILERLEVNAPGDAGIVLLLNKL